MVRQTDARPPRADAGRRLESAAGRRLLGPYREPALGEPARASGWPLQRRRQLSRRRLPREHAGSSRFELKDEDASVQRASDRFRHLGFRVSRAAIEPTDEVLAKMRRRLRRLALDGDIEKLRRSIASYRGLWAFDGSAGG